MDIELLLRKATQAGRALERIRAHLPKSPDRFCEQYDAQDIVYRNFQIVVQNCVDMGSHVISNRGWEVPKTMGSVFDILGTHRIISPKQVKYMRGMVTLRNIIVYDYARLDHRLAHNLINISFKVVPSYILTMNRKKTRKN